MGAQQSPLTLTNEQTSIVGFNGHRLVVKAFAGAGKTFVLTRYALHRPDLRILYVAYNRAIKDEAVTKFPSNVVCKTMHQLAFASFGRKYKHKLKPNLRLRDIADTIEAFNWALAADIQKALSSFMSSADNAIDTRHFPVANDAAESIVKHQSNVLKGAQQVWAKMIDEHDAFTATHDMYLKLFQLSQPDLSQRYDVILMDEAQDQNPCSEAIVLGQPSCKLILVGDSHQQVYGFRGAEDAMDSPAFSDVEVLYLTQSFRFGPKVAEAANALLAMKGETVKVSGWAASDCVVPAKQFALKHSPAPQVTFLGRTVMGVLHCALFFSRRHLKVHLVNGYEAYNLQLLEDLFWLSVDKKENVRDKRLLVDFFCFSQYEDMAKQSGDPEMQRAVKVLDTYPKLDKELALLKSRLVPTEEEADIVVTTAHRSKGLEWPVTYLLDDYPDVLDPKMPRSAQQDEINLLYVAATRAQQMLVANELLGRILQMNKVDGWR